MNSVGEISQLLIYPVKSCRGIALTHVELTQTGFAQDREWMVTDPNGEFITQREEPRLALVSTQIHDEYLELQAPGMESLRLPWMLKERSALRSVRVWSDSVEAIDCGEESSTWWSRFLGRTAHLVRWNPAVRRLSSLQWTQGIEAANAFSDGFPILVVSEASLEDLNARLHPAPPLSMDRFRPNLVLKGIPAYCEDTSTRLKIADIEIRIVKPCARCPITTTDQDTAIVNGIEPLRTLATYRRNSSVSGVIFGQNAILVQGIGQQLRLGQKVEMQS